MTKVPIFDLKQQWETLRFELLSQIERVLTSGHYILGPEVEAFELEAKNYLQAKFTIGCASGTDALWLSLKALGIGPGDYVLTSPFTFFATASAILNTGAQPVFADIEPNTFNISPAKVLEILQGKSSLCQRLGIRPERIKAIIPVHLYGQSADMKELSSIAQTYKLSIVEDAAQALGSQYNGTKIGTLGTLAAFSFFPTKNLGAFGDGGLVSTNNEQLADHVKLLRGHGSKKRYYHDIIGTNSRLDALQAAILRVKLKYLDQWISQRQTHARKYNDSLEKISHIRIPFVSSGRNHTYHQYTIRVLNGNRDKLQTFLKENSVETIVYYPLALHLQPALAHLKYKMGDFPEVERATQEVLSLPIFPELSPEACDQVSRSIIKFSEANEI